MRRLFSIGVQRTEVLLWHKISKKKQHPLTTKLAFSFLSNNNSFDKQKNNNFRVDLS
jgi:hypothetical protein